MLVWDYQEIYQMRYRAAIEGPTPARHVLELLDGLLSHPHSRFRAQYLTDHPPKPNQDGPSWLWWTPDTSALTTLADLLMGLAGKKAEPMQRPGNGARHHRPKTIQELVAALKGS
ncbi:MULTISPECIES: hypothetical protein [unclassified Pseudoclavibacter]|uniref:hypothetical protein n=1 Tax=unclassified Pseudoclavibacter TaxID=2615177 RepID=UPI001BA9A966|nr:hypothetical protein [Pseudoclavibacter sp. Marseille-Q4354]MBS3177755.1 hypothetical protein [Pseudoclavibacter sp. Marseille-Q4354]